MKDAKTFKVLISFITITILGCGGTDSVDEEMNIVSSAQFVSVDPLHGSLLLPGSTTFTVLFDNKPKGLRVIQKGVKGSLFKVKHSNETVTITGEFPLGDIILVLRWGTEEYTLTYRVQDEVVLIHGSEFEMGSDTNVDEKPIHTVFVDTFYIDKNEVTVGAYRKFIQKTGHPPPDWHKVSHYSPTDEHPIVFVSWHDAMTYAKWVGKRLPTEAEWEKAARGGIIQQIYPWGDTVPDGKQCNFADKNLTLYWWAAPLADDGYAFTAPIGSYPINEYVLYDMAGNVWEWCLDEYDSDFYVIGSKTDPIAGLDTIEDIVDVFSSVQSPRVLRGGSWLVTSKNVRNAVRFRLDPTSRSSDVGFRCVMDFEILE